MVTSPPGAIVVNGRALGHDEAEVPIGDHDRPGEQGRVADARQGLLVAEDLGQHGAVVEGVAALVGRADAEMVEVGTDDDILIAERRVPARGREPRSSSTISST